MPSEESKADKRERRARWRRRGWNLLSACGGFLIVCSLIAPLGAWFWLFDLASHWPRQYALGFSLLTVAFGLRRQWRWAALFLAFALFHLGTIAPYYRVLQPPPASRGIPFRILLCNVMILSTQYARVQRLIAENHPDMVILCELSPEWFTALSDLNTTYPYRARNASTDQFGIGLWSRYPITRSEALPLGDTGRTTLIAEMGLDRAHPLTLVATHPCPPSGGRNTVFRNRQLAAVAAHLRTMSGARLLIGDLNTTPWSISFRHLVRDSGLRDSARLAGADPSWPSFPAVLRIPLDHCLLSSGLTVTGKHAGESVGSDHLPLLIDLRLDTIGAP